MPELPEVETIARYLRDGRDGAPPLPGQVIRTTHLLWPRTLAEPEPAAFAAALPERTVTGLGRRAKFLRILLDQGELVIHLRMSGDLRVEPDSAPVQTHDRLLLDFASGWRLVFNDTRKFGRAWLLDDSAALFAGLGLEPFSKEFTPDWLHAALQTRRRQLKPLLLDQTFIAGLGNIYTDEALHLAGLHPLRLADQVTPAQAERLWQGICTALQAGLDAHGASIDWVYRGGSFQNEFRVYGRAGAACPVCGAAVQRIVVGQRGTHFCPVCQPAG